MLQTGYFYGITVSARIIERSPGGQKYGKIPYLCPPPGFRFGAESGNLIIERGGGQRYGILPYFCPPGSVL